MLVDLLLAPLRILYFRGPAWGGWGFWEGRPPGEICSELTHIPAHHFEYPGSGGSDECHALLDRKFTAFTVGGLSVVGGLLFLGVAANCVHYYFTIRPVLRHLESRRRHREPAKKKD